MSAVSDRDEARQRREEARNRRRGQAPESAAEAEQQQDEPHETDGNGGHPTRDSLMSAATVAAAGAAVGAALGAARALTDRDDSAHEDATDREHREPEPAADLEPEAEAEAKAEPDPDETSDSRAEPQAEGAPEPELEPVPEPREETPVAGATPDETAEVVRSAREQLRALHGSEPESISSLERTPRGWRATFEVVELERVPDSTDVLASYEVVLDEDRNVTRYARIRRYYRAQADHEERA